MQLARPRTGRICLLCPPVPFLGPSYASTVNRQSGCAITALVLLLVYYYPQCCTSPLWGLCASHSPQPVTLHYRFSAMQSIRGVGCPRGHVWFLSSKLSLSLSLQQDILTCCECCITHLLACSK